MSIIELIYSITAFASLFFLVVILIKFIMKRLSKLSKIFQKANKQLMKIHKFVFFSLLFTASVHGILTFTRIEDFGPNPYILGVLCLTSCIASALVFYFKRKLKNPMSWVVFHRILALAALVLFVVHFALTR